MTDWLLFLLFLKNYSKEIMFSFINKNEINIDNMLYLLLDIHDRQFELMVDIQICK